MKPSSKKQNSGVPVTLTIKNMKRNIFFFNAKRKEKRFRVPLNHVKIGRKKEKEKYTILFSM